MWVNRELYDLEGRPIKKRLKVIWFIRSPIALFDYSKFVDHIFSRKDLDEIVRNFLHFKENYDILDSESKTLTERTEKTMCKETIVQRELASHLRLSRDILKDEEEIKRITATLAKQVKDNKAELEKLEQKLIEKLKDGAAVEEGRHTVVLDEKPPRASISWKDECLKFVKPGEEKMFEEQLKELSKEGKPNLYSITVK